MIRTSQTFTDTQIGTLGLDLTEDRFPAQHLQVQHNVERAIQCRDNDVNDRSAM